VSGYDPPGGGWAAESNCSLTGIGKEGCTDFLRVKTVQSPKILKISMLTKLEDKLHHVLVTNFGLPPKKNYGAKCHL
jgi:hypothetical protein